MYSSSWSCNVVCHVLGWTWNRRQYDDRILTNKSDMRVMIHNRNGRPQWYIYIYIYIYLVDPSVPRFSSVKSDRTNELSSMDPMDTNNIVCYPIELWWDGSKIDCKMSLTMSVTLNHGVESIWRRLSVNVAPCSEERLCHASWLAIQVVKRSRRFYRFMKRTI